MINTNQYIIKKIKLLNIRFLFLIVLVIIAFRIFLIELFTIPSASMSPTLQTGDKIIVSKLQYGARLPRSGFEIPWLNLFWFLNPAARADMGKNEWGYRRINGYSKIGHDDVVVFNYLGNMFEFYIKRCVALPGDSLQIIKGKIYINKKEQNSNYKVKHYYKVYYNDFDKTLGLLDSLNISCDSFFFRRKKLAYLTCNISLKQKSILEESAYFDSLVFHIDTAGNEASLFPFIDSLNWSKDNYGPLYIPAKGQNIELTPKNYAVYAAVINKFENTEISTTDSGFYIGNRQVKTYRFKQNYYFMMGDNRSLSMDSRYWGFVPESDIVGKAVLLLFSYNSGFRWKRMFKAID